MWPANTAVTLPAAASPFPVVPVVAPHPARVVQEDEDVARVRRPFQGALEKGQLLGAHALAFGLVEIALARLWIGLVGVQAQEPAVLVAQGVPQGAEVRLVVGLVFALGPAGAAPVHIVVARHRVPGTQQVVHDAPELTHLRHPLGPGVVTIDQIAHGHHQIGLHQIHVRHGLGQDPDTLHRPARAVAEDGEGEGLILGGQVQKLSSGPVRLQAVGILAQGLERTEDQQAAE